MANFGPLTSRKHQTEQLVHLLNDPSTTPDLKRAYLKRLQDLNPDFSSSLMDLPQEEVSRRESVKGVLDAALTAAGAYMPGLGAAVKTAVPALAGLAAMQKMAGPVVRGSAASLFPKQAGVVKGGDAKKMLMGVYRGFAGDKASPLVHYHGGTYTPGEKVTKPLYLSRDPEMAESYAWAKGGELQKVNPKPKKTAPQSTLDTLAKEHVPKNAEYDYTPASALDSALHDEKAVNRMVYELGRTPNNYDSARAFDIGFGSPGKTPEGEVLIMLPGSTVEPVPDIDIFATPQRRVAEYYANKRASKSGETPHLEMLMVDPFAGKNYGHATAGTGAVGPMTTKAKKLKPDDIKDRFDVYAHGGSVKAQPTTQTPENLQWLLY